MRSRNATADGRISVNDRCPPAGAAWPITLLRSPLVPWALVAAAVVAAVTSKLYLFVGMSWNRDEAVYLWQADLLRHGQLTASDLGFPDVVQPWLSGHRDGAFVPQYTLGWPILLLVATTAGSPVLALAAATALAVGATYAFALEVTRRRDTAAASACLLLASPIVVIHSGLHLNYLFTAGVGAAFATLALRSVRLESRSLGLAAGALLGVTMTTRTYDALIWAMVVVGFVTATERRRWRRLLWSFAPIAVGALPFLGAQLAHNWYVTGHPLELPFALTDPLDRFGFGLRRIMPDEPLHRYGLSDAAGATAKNLVHLPWFIAGSYLTVGLAVIGAATRCREPATWLLVALSLAFPLAYFPFWGTLMSSHHTVVYGPIYLVPVYIPMCILASQGLRRCFSYRPATTARLAMAVLLLTLAANLVFVSLHRQASQVQLAWRHNLDQITDRALVVVAPSTYLAHLQPWAINGADPDPRILFATNSSPELIRLIEAHPDRRAVMQRATTPTRFLKGFKAFQVELVPIRLVRGDVLEIEVIASPPAHGAMSIAIGHGELVWRDVPGGRNTVTGDPVRESFLLGPEDYRHPTGDLTIPDGGSIVDIVVGTGPSHDQARQNPTLKYELLVQNGRTLRALSPGTVYERSDSNTNKTSWVNAGLRMDLQVEVRGRAS